MGCNSSKRKDILIDSEGKHRERQRPSKLLPKTSNVPVTKADSEDEQVQPSQSYSDMRTLEGEDFLEELKKEQSEQYQRIVETAQKSMFEIAQIQNYDADELGERDHKYNQRLRTLKLETQEPLDSTMSIKVKKVITTLAEEDKNVLHEYGDSLLNAFKSMQIKDCGELTVAL